MQTRQIYFLFTSLLAFGEAVPVCQTQTPKAFTVQQIANPDYAGPAPLAIHMAQVHAKYNLNNTTFSYQATAAVSVSAGGVFATPQSGVDDQFLSPVTIGNQSFQLSFDTGSTDTWVLSANIIGGTHSRYVPALPASLVSGKKWSLKYGDGSTASGDVWKDTINIGGVQVTNQEVERANAASGTFVAKVLDGILGLGFDRLNQCTSPQCTSFMTNAVSQGLPQNVFTASLKYHAPGLWDFGVINPSRYKGNITYTAVNDNPGYWNITNSGYAIGTGAVNNTKISGIVDSGTSLLYLPDAVVRSYYSQVSGSTYSSQFGGWIFPCGSMLPDYTTVFGSYNAVVPGKHINYAQIISDGSACYGGIQSTAGGLKPIYGLVFIKSQFLVFDRANKRLGLANPAS